MTLVGERGSGLRCGSGVTSTLGRHGPQGQQSDGSTSTSAALLDTATTAGPAGPVPLLPRGKIGPVEDPDKRVVRLHGHRLAYWVSGAEPSPERPVLVLVHGIAGSATTWREVLPALGQHYTVIAPDLLGHGESDKPRHDYSLGAYANLLRDLMFALGIERATIVGHSLGGGIGMQLAYQHPMRCERLVLVASGGLGQEVSWMLARSACPASST